MKQYAVTLTQGIDFAPDTEVGEILQNVRTIISTRRGEVPLDRLFGLPWDSIDQPIPVARALMRAAIIEAVRDYEPRATVRSVEFEEDEEDALGGITRPRVIVTIGNDEEADV